MMEKGADIIENFCQDTIGSVGYCEKLAGDASAREYYRVQCGDETCVVCHDPSFEGAELESFPYYQVYKIFTAHDIPVPRVICFDAPRGLLLLEDAGDHHLEDHAEIAGPDSLSAVYEELIAVLVRIQSIRDNGSIPFTLAFDVEKLMFEFSFFLEHAMEGYFSAALSDSVKRELERGFLRVSGSLQRRELFVLNHRDYHSRNILIREGDLFIIDFQDARLGLPHYDLVSLLRDSYVRLPDEMFISLRELYFEQASDAGLHSLGADEFLRYFDLSAFQRNVKALGTFGYLVTKKGKALYEKYILDTLNYLPEYAERNPELSGPVDIILDAAGGAR